MYEIKIDTERCKKDGSIACGQCVAICPQNAISNSEFPSTTIRAIQFEQMPTTEQVMTLLKTRRIPDLIGIPPGNELYGALALGYPIPRFKNMIERKRPIIRLA